MPSFSSVRSAESLRKLRSLVKRAAKELRRLKKENAALAARIRELEAGPRIDPNATLLMFEEDPKRMKTAVNGFIQAIDNYLAKEGE